MCSVDRPRFARRRCRAVAWPSASRRSADSTTQLGNNVCALAKGLGATNVCATTSFRFCRTRDLLEASAPPATRCRGKTTLPSMRAAWSGTPTPTTRQSHDCLIPSQLSTQLNTSSLLGVFWTARSSIRMRSTSRVGPNPSLERTSTGLALGPRTGQCHHPLRGPSPNPAGSAQLKR
jgi:hypothetical protein